jgi:hypothetical protein
MHNSGGLRMIHVPAIRRSGAFVGAACVLSLCILPVARAQHAPDTEVREEIGVSQADIAAAANAGPGLFRALPARIPGAKEAVARIHRESEARAAEKGLTTKPAPAAVSNALTGPYFYPADVASGGGPTLATARQHALYVNYTGSVASNWGNPERFLSDLNESTFIHLVDQYAGSTADDRYPVGSHAKVHYSFSGNILYESDLAAIAHAAALKHGAGLGSIYHVFLPAGQDTCFDLTPGSSPVCYSPDNFSTFYFCAYHDAVLFSDIGWVLFTVEPFQDTPGCAEAVPSANGQLADSTYTTLNHETFETISDPLPPTGYTTQVDFIGNEIGDECISPYNSSADEMDPTLTLNGRHYNVQLIYSNTYHACASVP